MLGNLDKQKISALLQSPQWDAIEAAAKEYIANVQASTSSGQTEFETLKTFFQNEGRVMGVQEFLGRLEQSLNDKN